MYVGTVLIKNSPSPLNKAISSLCQPALRVLQMLRRSMGNNKGMHGVCDVECYASCMRWIQGAPRLVHLFDLFWICFFPRFDASNEYIRCRRARALWVCVVLVPSRTTGATTFRTGAMENDFRDTEHTQQRTNHEKGILTGAKPWKRQARSDIRIVLASWSHRDESHCPVPAG